MASVNIIKGSIRNVVDEVQFEKLYKPNGWVIDESVEKTKKPVPDEIKTETELKNYIAMKNIKPKKFDDGLFYSDGQKED